MAWQSEPRRLPPEDVHRVMLATSPLDVAERMLFDHIDELNRILDNVEVARTLSRAAGPPRPKLTVIEGDLP